jgi:hypothetical protein
MARQVALVGNRLSLAERPRSWRTRFIRSAESSRSWMVKAGSRPIRGAYSRSSRAPMAWKVPAQVNVPVSAPVRPPPSAPPADRFAPNAFWPIRCTRRVISTEARRENVIKDAAGIDAAGGQMHHAVGERAGLSRSRPRDHQESRGGIDRRRTNTVLADAVLANAVLDGAALVRVELVEIGRHWRGRIALLEAKQDEPCSVFVRNRDNGARRPAFLASRYGTIALAESNVSQVWPRRMTSPNAIFCWPESSQIDILLS